MNLGGEGKLFEEGTKEAANTMPPKLRSSAPSKSGEVAWAEIQRIEKVSELHRLTYTFYPQHTATSYPCPVRNSCSVLFRQSLVLIDMPPTTSLRAVTFVHRPTLPNRGYSLGNCYMSTMAQWGFGNAHELMYWNTDVFYDCGRFRTLFLVCHPSNLNLKL